ncbi:MAG: hypothetical protein LUH19_03810 [Lachnospiraceae bacterium]|nr:hypothetical protein [Lachnospiraceae bacterium]
MDVQYIRLTDKTRSWFLPLLPAEFQNSREDDGIYTIGAVCEKTACGVLVFQLRNAMADIRWLLVSEGFRRRKIATGMIGYLCAHAWDSVTPVTCTFPALGKSDPLYLLFEEMDTFSVSEEEGFTYQIPCAKAAQNPTLLSLGGHGRTPRLFLELSPTLRKSFYYELHAQGIYYLEDIREEEMVPSLCLCTVDEKKITAALFFTGKNENLELSFAYSASGAQKDLMELFSQACRRLPQEGNLKISAVNPASLALMEKLLPEKETIAGFYRAVWDMEL